MKKIYEYKIGNKTNLNKETISVPSSNDKFPFPITMHLNNVSLKNSVVNQEITKMTLRSYLLSYNNVTRSEGCDDLLFCVSEGASACVHKCMSE